MVLYYMPPKKSIDEIQCQENRQLSGFSDSRKEVKLAGNTRQFVIDWEGEEEKRILWSSLNRLTWYRFLPFLKVEQAYETFSKLKWHKTKKQ